MRILDRLHKIQNSLKPVVAAVLRSLTTAYLALPIPDGFYHSRLVCWALPIAPIGILLKQVKANYQDNAVSLMGCIYFCDQTSNKKGEANLLHPYAF